MKDIFDIINSQPQQRKNRPQQNNPKPVQKSYVQKLIEEGKEDLSSYVLKPQKKFMTKAKLSNKIAEAVQGMDYTYSLDEVVEYIKIAKHRKMSLADIEMKTGDDKKMNILEYTLYNFRRNIETKSGFVRYLLANSSDFDNEDALTKCMSKFLEYQYSDGEYLLRDCEPDFIKTYKLLIDHGASTQYITNVFFDSMGKLKYENADVIELLFYEQELTSQLLNSFYVCDKPYLFYPIMKRYGYTPSLDKALQNLRYSNGEKVLRYLVDNGVIQKEEITDQAIRIAMSRIKFRRAGQKTTFLERANAIRTGRKTVTTPAPAPAQKNKKVSKKQTIVSEIDKLFENALKNADELAK